MAVSKVMTAAWVLSANGISHRSSPTSPCSFSEWSGTAVGSDWRGSCKRVVKIEAEGGEGPFRSLTGTMLGRSKQVDPRKGRHGSSSIAAKPA